MLNEIKRIIQRAIWSWQGFVHVIRTEHSIYQWLVANALSIILMFVLPVDATTRGFLIMGGVFILAMECLNTAVERVVDDISLEKRDAARHAKDSASAAVALSAIGVGIAWCFVIWSLFAA